MENHIARAAKMLILFAGRRKGEALVKIAKAAGARGGTISLGKTLGTNRFLRALSLADIQQDVVFVIVGPEKNRVLAALREAAEGEPGTYGGMAVVIDVPQFYTLRTKHNANTKILPKAERKEPMDSGYKLVSVIVNTGYGDDVMAAARKAGARGGTILGARGTGTEDDVKFFGITLVPEKEMLLIVAEEGKVDGIIKSIATIPTLCEPGGGIIYNMNVEEFIVLGK